MYKSKFVKGCESSVRGMYITKDGTRVKDKCEEEVEALQDRSVCCVEHLSISLKWALGNLDWMLTKPLPSRRRVVRVSYFNIVANR